MTKLSLALLTLVALLTLSSVALRVSAAPTVQEEPNNFTAQLDGNQQVPPRTTDATGQATFQLRDEAQLGFTLIMFDIKNVAAVHLHCAPPGENGPVGVTLFGPMAPGGGAAGTAVIDIILILQGTITAPDPENGCGWADLAAVVEAMGSGTAYVNVRTDDRVDPPDTGPGDFPGGEIRGQIEEGPAQQ